MPFCRHVALASLLVLTTFTTASAEQLSMKECSARFQAARESGKLGQVKWSEFRKTECGFDTAPAETMKPGATQKPAKIVEAPAGVTFPGKIDGKFAAEKPAQQRMKTCRDAYHANKAAKTLGGLRWIQKGGGYYSLCSARLKKTAAQ